VNLDDDSSEELDALVAEKSRGDHALVLVPAKGPLSFRELIHALN
jgi:hypothetical protein